LTAEILNSRECFLTAMVMLLAVLCRPRGAPTIRGEDQAQTLTPTLSRVQERESDIYY